MLVLNKFDFPIKISRVFYAVGIAGIGIQQYIYGEFRPVIFPSWPSWVLVSSVEAYIIGSALITASAFIIAGMHVKEICLLLGGFLLAMFIIFQCPYVLFVQPNSAYHLGLWTDPLKELALAGGAFVIVELSNDETSDSTRKRFFGARKKFIPFGKIFFSFTMISFGIDHFFYTDFVSTLIPSWIPDHKSWTYIAGVALIASGVAIILNIRRRKVSLLLSAMLFLWVILLHLPRAVADRSLDKGNAITSVFEALAFSGIALAIACTKKRKMTKASDVILLSTSQALQPTADKQAAVNNTPDKP